MPNLMTITDITAQNEHVLVIQKEKTGLELEM